MTGKLLYAIYRGVFHSVFAPKWDELDDYSKIQWDSFAKKVKHEIAITTQVP